MCFGIFLHFLATPSFSATVECTPITLKSYSDRNSKIDIREPGRYCLFFDVHARFDLPDRPAEGRQIHIWGSNVELDLKGHTIGRGRLYVQPGGIGIELEEDSHNITISNGIIENFTVGIYRTGFKSEKIEVESHPVIVGNNYVFANDIRLKNIVFKNCEKNYSISYWENVVPKN